MGFSRVLYYHKTQEVEIHGNLEIHSVKADLTMNVAILMAFGIALAVTCNDLIMSKQSRNANGEGAMSFYFLSSVFSMIVAGLFMLVRPGGIAGFGFSSADVFFGILMGLLSFGTYYFYIRSFTKDNTTTAVTIFRMNMVPGIILAILFTGEEITLKRGLGIVACVISIALLSSWNFKGQKMSIHLVFSFCAMFMGATLNLVNKIAVRQGAIAFNLIFWRFAVVTVITAGILLFQKTWTMRMKTAKYTFLSGSLMVLSIFLMMSALKSIGLSQIQPIAQMALVFVAIISWLFYKEAMTPRKILGIVFAFVTVILIV